MNKKHSREDIVIKGEEILRGQGYHNTGIRDILDSCGISKGTFYNYFEDKEGFTLEVIDWYSARMEGFVASFLSEDTGLSPLNRLRSLYEMFISFAEGEGCSKGCLVYNMSLETGGISDVLASSLKRHMEHWIALIQPCVEAGQKIGEIRSDFDSKEIARLLQTSFNGAFANMKVSRNSAFTKNMIDVTLRLISQNSST